MSGIWSDSAIASKDEDRFGRAAYAGQVANLIASTPHNSESTVFGLTGSWGSGKTSMLSMITETLETSHSNWKVARFTPWATGDVPGLLGDFYASLSDALPNDASGKVRQALATLARISAPAANLIPVVGGVATGTLEFAAQQLNETIPWQTSFENAARKLEELDIPVLMIADDIDRLQTEELLTLLRVVRLLGRFKGVHYLLSYDDTTLSHALSATGLASVDRGAGIFMEKIVQYPLMVPPLLPTQLHRALNTAMDEALQAASRPRIDSRRLGRLLAVYQEILPTPRAIGRYAAQLRHLLPLMPADEVCDEDVLILTLVRTAFPALFNALPQWRQELLTGHTQELKSAATSLEFEDFETGPLLDLVPSRQRASARILLGELFPKLDSKRSRQVDDVSGRHVCDEPYFDRYFATSILDHDVSDREVADALRNAITGKDLVPMEQLLTEEDPYRSSLIVQKMVALTNLLLTSSHDASAVLKVVGIIGNVSDRVQSNRTLFSSPRERLLAWAGRLIGSLPDDTSADSVAESVGRFVKLTDRASIFYDAIRGKEREAGPEYMVALQKAISVNARELLLENLKKRDDAPGNIDAWIPRFLRQFADKEEISQIIADGLGRGDFQIDDVAARFISTRYWLGGDDTHELGDPDQAAYDVLVPPLADPWYEEIQQEVNIYDLSWQNRRRYAAGRIRQPPAASATTVGV